MPTRVQPAGAVTVIPADCSVTAIAMRSPVVAAAGRWIVKEVPPETVALVAQFLQPRTQGIESARGDVVRPGAERPLGQLGRCRFLVRLFDKRATH